MHLPQQLLGVLDLLQRPRVVRQRLLELLELLGVVRIRRWLARRLVRQAQRTLGPRGRPLRVLLPQIVHERLGPLHELKPFARNTHLG